MAPAATVYLAVNGVNGKKYVGVTRFSVAKRWGEHRSRAKMGIKSRLYSAIRRHGVEQFAVEPIASCLSIEAASEVERAIIKQIAPEYNQTNGGEITKGRRVPPEVVAKIAASNRGKRKSPETIAKISEAKRRRIQEDPIYRAQVMMAIKKATSCIDREKQKAVASRMSRDRVWSEASRAKLSASCMGRRYSADILEKSAAARRKAVRCTTTGQVFASCAEAAIALKVGRYGVYKVLVGARQTVRGFRFEYLKGDVS